MSELKQENPVIRTHDVGRKPDQNTTVLPICCPACGHNLMAHWTHDRRACHLLFCQHCTWFFNLDAYSTHQTVEPGPVTVSHLSSLVRQLRLIIDPTP